MSRQLFAVAILVTLTTFYIETSHAGDGVGIWVFKSDVTPNSGTVTATCNLGGKGTYKIHNNPDYYPARCQYSGAKLTISAWGIEEAVNVEPPVVRMRFTIDGDYISGTNEFQGRELFSGYRQGTKGRTQAEIAQASRSQINDSIDINDTYDADIKIKRAKNEHRHQKAEYNNPRDTQQARVKAAAERMVAEKRSKTSRQDRYISDSSSSNRSSKSSPSIGGTPQRSSYQEWDNNAYSACNYDCEHNLKLKPRDIDSGPPMKACLLGCSVIHSSSYSTVSGFLKCEQRGNFSEAVSKRLSKESLSGYAGYAENVWSWYNSKKGCAYR